MIFFFLVYGYLLPTVNAVAHDFHLSKTDIHYNEQNQSLEVTMHIFIDDLEVAMRLNGTDSLFIATGKERSDADELIHQYLRSVFSVYVDGDQIEFQFLGKEESDDLIAIWCYLEGNKISDPAMISIRNSILTDLYDDQKNMVSFTGKNVKKFFLMNDKIRVAEIKL